MSRIGRVGPCITFMSRIDREQGVVDRSCRGLLEEDVADGLVSLNVSEMMLFPKVDLPPFTTWFTSNLANVESCVTFKASLLP